MIIQEWVGNRSSTGNTPRKLIVWEDDGTLRNVFDRDSTDVQVIRDLQRNTIGLVTDLGQLRLHNFRRTLKPMLDELKARGV